MKRTIRLSESDLHRMIRNVVKEAIKSENGMTDDQKRKRRNQRFMGDMKPDKHSITKPWDTEPGFEDSLDREYPFKGQDWVDNKIESERMKQHRRTQKHSDIDSEPFQESLNRAIRESVKRVLRESMDNDIITSLAKEYSADPQSIRQQNANVFSVPIDGHDHDVYVFNNEQEACDYLWNNWGLEDYCEGAADIDYWQRGCPECFDENGTPDWHRIAQKVLNAEGPAWFIDGYDGSGTTLSNGMIAYRYD